MHRRKFLTGAAAAGGAVLVPRRQGAIAQTTASPMRIVFPFAAGGGGDAACRLIGEQIAPVLGRTILVENRTGADGRIAIQSVKAAAPDGDTVLVTTGPTMWLMPLVHKSPGYDPFKDFEPVSHVASFEFCVAVANNTGLGSLPELIAWVKANPDKATYGLPGAGTIPHFIGVALAKHLGVDMRRLPYRGGALAMNDLVSGQIPLSIGTVSDAIQQHRAGTIRILAITSATRSPFVPEVPTLTEGGVAIVGDAWYGMWVPARTPPAVVARLGDAVQAALQTPDLKQRFERFGLIATGSPPAKLAQMMQENQTRWAAIVKESGYTMDQ